MHSSVLRCKIPLMHVPFSLPGAYSTLTLLVQVQFWCKFNSGACSILVHVHCSILVHVHIQCVQHSSELNPGANPFVNTWQSVRSTLVQNLSGELWSSGARLRVTRANGGGASSAGCCSRMDLHQHHQHHHHQQQQYHQHHQY